MDTFLSILSEVAKFVLPLLTMLGFIAKPIKTIFEQINAINTTAKMLLRDRLIWYHDEYTTRGWVTTKEKENYVMMCEQYWALHFNHFSKEMLEDVKRLRNIAPNLNKYEIDEDNIKVRRAEQSEINKKRRRNRNDDEQQNI